MEQSNEYTLEEFENNKTFLDGAFTKNRELATAEDAKNLGLLPGDERGIVIHDRMENLVMFSVKKNYMTEMKLNLTDHKTKQLVAGRLSAVRGWIQDTLTEELIVKSFNEEIVIYLSVEQFKNSQFAKRDYELYKYLEGHTVRLFNHKGEWMFSSNRKIDCKKSKIPEIDKEIIELFNACSPNFDYAKLDSKLVYIFHIVHQLNQITNPEKLNRPMLYHLLTMNKRDIVQVEKFDFCEYLTPLTHQEAVDDLTIGRPVILRKNLEVVQIIPKHMEKLFNVRGHLTSDPMKSPELLYLALPIDDRPLLTQIIAYHLKDQVKPEFMESNLSRQAINLANVCTAILKDVIERNTHFAVTADLMRLTKTVRATMPFVYEDVHKLYVDAILKKFHTNGEGEFMYSCLKGMRSYQKRHEKRDMKAVNDAGHLIH